MDYQGSFEGSPKRAKLRFVVLETPSVRMGPYTDQAWPTDARWIRDTVKAKHPDWGTPMFVLVKDKAVVLTQAGRLQTAPFGFYPQFLKAIREAVGLA